MKAKEGEEFQFKDGSMATDAEELLAKVMDMSPQEFSEHVNEGKHDFHQWLSSCVDGETADQVREALDQRTLVEKLAGHMWEKEHKEKHGY